MKDPRNLIKLSYALSPPVELEPLEHRYFCGLTEYRSVSSILQGQGLMIWLDRLSPDVRESALERGRVVHRACELADKGTLERSSVDPQIAGYLEAYENWKAQT